MVRYVDYREAAGLVMAPTHKESTMTQDPRAFRRLLQVALTAFVMLVATTAVAETPEVQELVRGMKQALEPASRLP